MDPVNKQAIPETTKPAAINYDPALAPAVRDAVDELLDKTTRERRVDGVVAKWGTNSKVSVCSFDKKTPEGRALFSQCNDDADFEMADVIGSPVEVVGFMIHEIELADMNTAELVDKERTVLILKDNSTVDTCSGIFAESFARIAELVGPGPWEPPIILLPKVRTSRAGKKFYTCVELVRNKDGSVPAVEKAKTKK